MWALVHVHSWTEQHLRGENFWGTQKREGGVIWSAAAKYTILPSVPAHLDHLRCLFTQVPLCLGGGSQNFGHIDIWSGTKHNILHSLTLLLQQHLSNPRIDKFINYNHFTLLKCHTFCICSCSKLTPAVKTFCYISHSNMDLCSMLLPKLKSHIRTDLDDLFPLYLDLCIDHLYFTIQVTEKYSAAMY